jgi:hypothetical protein
MAAFTGLTQQHFDTYAREKWSSMVHNLARMKGKDVAFALSEHAAENLLSDLGGLQRAASDEIPNITNQKKVDSQWVYWFRDPEERKNLKSFLEKTPLNQNDIFSVAPHEKHITLALIVRNEEVWVGLRIPHGATVDHRNLTAKFEKSWEREKFHELLQELPEGAQLAISDEPQPTQDITLDTICLHAADMKTSAHAWTLGTSIPTEDAIQLGPDLADLIHRWIGALIPLYRFAAWTRENDFIEVNKKIQEEKTQRRHQAQSLGQGDKVRVTAGLFSGKVGVIESVDTKGKTKVRVGKMSVVVPNEELLPAR